MKHQPNVQDDIMFCTVCKAEVKIKYKEKIIILNKIARNKVDFILK